MVSDSTETANPPGSGEPNTLLNALVGAVVTIVTAPTLPVAAVFGGAAAGYLQRGDVTAGAKVGALSGAIAAVPVVPLVWLVLAFLGFGFVGLGADPIFGLTTVVLLFGVAVLVVYLVGAGALGGALGAYLRQEL
jgi:hypothetical protein